MLGQTFLPARAGVAGGSQHLITMSRGPRLIELAFNAVDANTLALCAESPGSPGCNVCLVSAARRVRYLANAPRSDILFWELGAVCSVPSHQKPRRMKQFT